MTPQELKNSILQLAVQGKLVPQDPSEGTGEELYKQIQAENNILINKGILKKQKYSSDVSKDDLPFDIPESWSVVRFSEIGQLLDGEKKSGESYPKLDAKFLRGNAEATLLSNGKYIEKGTKLILVDGENSGEVFSAICNGYMGSTFKVLYYTPLMCEDYVLNFLLFHKTDYRNNKKGAAIPHLNKDLFFNMPMPLPPLAEQERIVARIEELLPLIDRYEQAWTKLETFNKRFPSDMQKSLTHAAIQGKLVGHDPSEGTGEDLYRQIQATKNKLVKEGIIKKEKPFADITEEEIPFDIPSSWKWVRLGELIKFQGGYAYKSTSYVPSSNNQVVRLGNVKTNNLLLDVKQVFIPDDIAASTEDYLIQADDILVTMTGTRKKRDYFFTLAISENDLSMRKLYLNQRVGCLRPIKGIDVSFLLFVLQSEVIKDLIFAKETGTANQGNIGSEDMKRCILIPLPPLAEQKRIVQKLEQILPLCEKLK